MKKLATLLVLIPLLVTTTLAATPTAYNLGNVGYTTGTLYMNWQQPVNFFSNPDGSVTISGTISNNGVSITSGPQIWFQTNQANGTMYSSQITFSVPNGPNNMVISWGTTIPASKGFTGGDKFGAFLYDSGLHILGATGAQDPYQWIVSPSTLKPQPNQ